MLSRGRVYARFRRWARTGLRIYDADRDKLRQGLGGRAAAVRASDRASRPAEVRGRARTPLAPRVRGGRGALRRGAGRADRLRRRARRLPIRGRQGGGGGGSRTGRRRCSRCSRRKSGRRSPTRAPSGTSDGRGRSVRAWGDTTAGEGLFALSFDMREVSDGGAPSFVFALSAPAEWAGRLATITLSGPGGSVSLDGSRGAAMTILRDARTGRMTGMLRGQGSDAATRPGGSEVEVLVSGGVPAGAEWRR